MDFSYSEEQLALQELSGRILGGRFTDEFRKAFGRSREPHDAPLWEELAKAGLLGTAIGSKYGGSGLGLTELCLLLEEQGRTLAAVPLFASLVLGALPLQRFGSVTQRALLPRVIRGDLLLSAAFEEPGGTEPLRPATVARRQGSAWCVSGVKTCVPYALQAHFLLVAARTENEGAGLFLVAAGAPGVHVEPQAGTSTLPQAQVTLSEVRLALGDVLGLGEDGQTLRWCLEHAQVALAALQLGVTREALRRAVSYVSERQQFGRPIGSFQAVQHRLADCYIDIEALRSAYLRAVWALDNERPASAEVLAARWWAAQAGHRVTHAVQHVHGGLGADLEYPVHAFFLWAKQLEIALGGATQTLAAIGAELARGSVQPFT